VFAASTRVLRTRYFQRDLNISNTHGRILWSQNHSPTLSLLLILSMIFSGLYYLPHNAEAQGTPQYNDVSNGLPTQGLWVSKVRLHDIDDGVDVQWSVADADGDLLEIDILFRNSSNTELATISSGLVPSGSLFWDTSALGECDYYLAISASDGRATTWRNVSVSIMHPEFLVVLAPIQVITTDSSEGDNVVFFVIVSNAGDLDGIAELTWSVDGEAATTALVDLVADADGFSQFDWIATSGDHTITVSAGGTSQGVMVSVSSAPEVKVEEGLNPWIFSIPVIATVGGIATLLRRMRGSGGDDEDEFEWD